MIKKVFISIIILLTTCFVGFSQSVFINEIHYDNTGGDVNEGIEIAGPAGTNLACYSIYLYNGSNGLSYSPVTSLSGIIDDEGCGYGALWFPIAGIQNGNPDGIVLYNTCSSTVIQFLSYGGSFTATNSVANGLTSTNIGVTEPSATPVGQSLQLTGTGTTYPSFVWNTPVASSYGSINIGEDFCTACVLAAEPTTNSSILNYSNIGCLSIDLNWISGNGSNRIVVASTSPIIGTPTDQNTYVANSVFGAGAIISPGEFVVHNGSGSSVTITGLTQSTTYYFAIFEYNGVLANCEENYLTSAMLTGNSTTLSICVCPEITGILVDACGGSIEGINEFFTFQNGNSSLQIDSITATFPNGGSFCNSGCGAQTWVTNPSYVASLNATAGCGALFVELDPIPAGAEVIVFTGALPTYNFDFSGLCGNGPYYAIFANNTDPSGRFGNWGATCGDFRTLNVNFGTSCSDATTYDKCMLSNVDGDYVTFDAAGNPTYQNDGCTPTAILPITLLYFKGQPLNNQSNLLEWSTSMEINNEFFTIEKSQDAAYFTPLGTIFGAGNSAIQMNYNFVDDSPNPGINYYRLKQTDFNGDYKFSQIIVINNKLDDFVIYENNNILYINSNTSDFTGYLVIYDVSGRKIIEFTVNSNTKINLAYLNKGIYIYKLISDNKATSSKFILQ